MPVGQQVLASTLDVGAVLKAEGRLAGREVERSAVHAAQLRDVLELHRLYARDGLGLAVQAQPALVLGCLECPPRPLAHRHRRSQLRSAHP